MDSLTEIGLLVMASLDLPWICVPEDDLGEFGDESLPAEYGMDVGKLRAARAEDGFRSRPPGTRGASHRE